MRSRKVKQRRSGRVSPISLPRVTIGSLPDEVLLDIFDFCQMHLPWSWADRWWHAVVHVCRKWRYIVFASPLRLNLRLECGLKTSVKKTLDVWPRAFPIVVKGSMPSRFLRRDNIIAALEQHDRISEIYLNPTCTGLKRLYDAMKKPYPALTRLSLTVEIHKSTPVLRGTFLGGSAPRLKYLHLTGIPFPELPKFLPFCPDLVDLQLWDIPNTSYISPEAMATALSTLTKLQVLHIVFTPFSPDPKNRPPTSLTRIVLPALTYLRFYGFSEYLEDFVARIDTPALISLDKWIFKSAPI